jgi:hypothetical protein
MPLLNQMWDAIRREALFTVDPRHFWREITYSVRCFFSASGRFRNVGSTRSPTVAAWQSGSPKKLPASSVYVLLPLLRAMQIADNLIIKKRRRGPQPLGELLPAVLAELAANMIQSPPSGNPGKSDVNRPMEPRTSHHTKAKSLGKPGALSGHKRLIRQRGVTPVMYEYGET